MNNRKEYIDEVAEKMKKWDDDITVLEDKANDASESIKSEVEEKLQDLRIKKAELQGQFDKMKSSGDEAWEILNREFKEGFEKMKSAFEEAKKVLTN